MACDNVARRWHECRSRDQRERVLELKRKKTLINTSLSDILASANSSHKNEFDEELRMVKAVQESMRQWKERSLKHRHKRQTNIVCYGELGCFEDSGPFGYIDMLPQSPEEIDTKFYVFSTKNRFDSAFA